jgi:outer membrane protein assembly factor BamE
MRNPLRLAPLLALAAVCAGCLYRMEIQQGNMLDDTQVEQLQTGMTRSQVLYLLGTPMVPDAFDKDRWDYYHYLDSGRGSGWDYKMTRRVTVWFEDDKVARIEHDDGAARPAAAPAATPAPAPRG